jgi:hypothetical protein
MLSNVTGCAIDRSDVDGAATGLMTCANLGFILEAAAEPQQSRAVFRAIFPVKLRTKIFPPSAALSAPKERGWLAEIFAAEMLLHHF